MADPVYIHVNRGGPDRRYLARAWWPYSRKAQWMGPERKTFKRAMQDMANFMADHRDSSMGYKRADVIMVDPWYDPSVVAELRF